MATPGQSDYTRRPSDGSSQTREQGYLCGAGEILDEGFLVQKAGVNQETGEAWKPMWVLRNHCHPDLLAKWEARKMTRADDATIDCIAGNSQHSVHKRSLSPEHGKLMKEEQGGDIAFVKSEDNVCQKRLELDISDLQQEHVEKEKLRVPCGRPSALSTMFHPKSKSSQLSRAKAASTSDFPLKEDRQMDVNDTSSPLGSVSTKPFEIDTQWLLNVGTKKGMVVVIRGSSNDGQGGGWYQGQHEGSRGVVLSVFNSGNSSFTSTARTRLLDSRDPSQGAFTIPTNYLWPVEPDTPGQKALILDGEHKDEVAIIREDDQDGWFVSVRSMHFVVAATRLVQIIDVDVDGLITADPM